MMMTAATGTMSDVTGLFLFGTAHVCITVFCARIIWRAVLLWRVPADRGRTPEQMYALSPATVFRAAADILFLTRLFRTNRPLWAGEIIFHVTFILVLVRHARYFLFPVPEWIVHFQPVGIYAGYLLALSLVYILIVKCAVERKQYFSSYNFFLLLLLLTISLTGFILKLFTPADIVEIKYFVLSTFTFSPAAAPKSVLFAVHFIVSFVLLASLPSHILSAPLTLLNARRRDEGLDLVMHEK